MTQLDDFVCNQLNTVERLNLNSLCSLLNKILQKSYKSHKPCSNLPKKLRKCKYATHSDVNPFLAKISANTKTLVKGHCHSDWFSRAADFFPLLLPYTKAPRSGAEGPERSAFDQIKHPKHFKIPSEKRKCPGHSRRRGSWKRRGITSIHQSGAVCISRVLLERERAASPINCRRQSPHPELCRTMKNHFPFHKL